MEPKGQGIKGKSSFKVTQVIGMVKMEIILLWVILWIKRDRNRKVMVRIRDMSKKIIRRKY